MSERELHPDAAMAAEQPAASVPGQPVVEESMKNSQEASPAMAPSPAVVPSAMGQQVPIPPSEDEPQPTAPAASDVVTSNVAATTMGGEPQPFQKIELPPDEEKPTPVVVTDELLARLQQAMERGETITVHVAQRIRGGLRVTYEGIKMFLPASQFYLKKTPNNEELQAAVGTDLPVQITEIVKDEAGRISFIVSRRKLLRDEFYRRIKVGDIIEGTVTSVHSFGLFVDVGGFDGLVHITRVAHQPPANLAAVFKQGDKVRAQVIEVDPEHDKISLSMKALEPSPWQTAAERYQPGQRYRGVVRRIAPFGAFVELEPGIEGLVRNSELSWTRRITNASEILRIGQEVEVMVLEVNPSAEQINLSLRRTTDNPWPHIAAKYPRGFHTTGVVRQVSGPGVLLTIGGEVDAFMPRSHMRSVLKGKRIPYSVGDIVAVTVVEVDVERESFIVEPRVEPEEELFGPPRDIASHGHSSKQQPQRSTNPNRITLGELLSEEERRRLFGDAGQS